MNKNISWLLTQDSLPNIVCTAGHKGCENIIKSVNIIDNPETVNWLKGGELVLTTGYILKDNEELQKAIIHDIKKKGCAGIGIKVKRYFQSIPEIMKIEADKVGLPLLEIPYSYGLSQIIKLIFTNLNNEKIDMLEKTNELYKRLSGMVMLGGSIENIIRELVEITNNSIILIDKEWKILSYDVCDYTSININEYINFSKGKQILDKETINKITSMFDEGYKMYTENIKYNDNKYQYIVLPLNMEDEIMGYLVLLEGSYKLEMLEYSVLEYAVTTLVLALLRDRAKQETFKHNRESFFERLLSGSIKSPLALHNIGYLYGMNNNFYYSVSVIKILEFKDENIRNVKVALIEKVLKHIEKIIEIIANDHGKVIITYAKDDSIVLFIKSSEQYEDMIDKDIFYIINSIYDAVCRKSEDSIKIEIGIGNTCKGLVRVYNSFIQALEALKLRFAKESMNSIVAYYDVIADSILNNAFSKNQLRSFYNGTIRKLNEHDIENNTEMIDTLKMLFKTKWNISETAKMLHLHRNTLIYRIDKIKSILNSELDDYNELLLLQLGLKSINLIEDFT